MSTGEVRIQELWTYPVKSCQGIELDVARIGDAGFEHDREFMLVDSSGAFLTQRHLPQLAKVGISINDDILGISIAGHGEYEHPVAGVSGRHKRTEVHKKPCIGVDQGDEAADYFSRYLGQEVRLLQASQLEPRFVKPDYHDRVSGNRVDFADGFPFLLTSRPSLDELHRQHGLEYGSVPMNRFRPNIVVDAPDLEPFSEDEWSVVWKGGIQLFVKRACDRCQIPSIIQNGEDAGEKGGLSVKADFLKSRKGTDLADPDKASGRFFGQNLVHSLGSVGLSIRTGDRFLIDCATQSNVALAV